MNALLNTLLREVKGLQDLRGKLGEDIRELSQGPRARFCTSATLSVALATIVALAMHLDNAWWAGISGFMSSQATRPASLTKGALRVIGTLAGAALGLVMASWLVYDPVACCLFLFFVTAAGVLGFQLSPHGYAWLLGAITFNIIILMSLTSPELAFNIAFYRTLEVVIGVAAAILMAFLIAPEAEGEAAPPPGCSGLFDAQWPAMLHAIRGGLTVMLVPLVWFWFELPSLWQMAITVAAVVAVPAPSDTAPDQGRLLVMRAIHRLIGCFLGGFVALACLTISPTQFLPWLLSLCMGVWAGCHIQTSPRGTGYVGTQATIVFIMALVQGFGPSASIWPGLDRLAGITFGLLLLLAVSLLLSAFQPSPPGAPANRRP
jgi:uncharacterized membrane protein YccC